MGQVPVIVAEAAPRLGFWRLVATTWFMLLSIIVAIALLAEIQVGPEASPLLYGSLVAGRLGAVLFYLTIAWAMAARPEPIAQDRGIGTVIVSFVASYAPWTIPLLPVATLSTGRALASALITLIGEALILWSITHLGLAFSLVPQARVIVREGPYRILRHPLYAAEGVAIIGILLQHPWWAVSPFFAALLVLQIVRISREERLLAAAIPGYDVYARGKSRLIPGVW